MLFLQVYEILQWLKKRGKKKGGGRGEKIGQWCGSLIVLHVPIFL